MVVKTKYDIGDTVWRISNNQVSCGKVTDVYIDVETDVMITYNLDNEITSYPERVLFESKDELLETL